MGVHKIDDRYSSSKIREYIKPNGLLEHKKVYLRHSLGASSKVSDEAGSLAGPQPAALTVSEHHLAGTSSRRATPARLHHSPAPSH